MDTHEPPNTYDIEALQKEIAALPDVRAVRVVTGSGGRVSEIHLVAEGGKAAKQLVRDVQTLAAAQFDLQIDHRVVSIVQFGDEDVPQSDHRAPSLASAALTTTAGTAVCRVEVRFGEDRWTGEASGTALTPAVRLAAQACVEALRASGTRAAQVELADVTVADVAMRRVVVVMLVTPAPNSEEIAVGSALVRADEAEAAARATLDAFSHRPA